MDQLRLQSLGVDAPHENNYCKNTMSYNLCKGINKPKRYETLFEPGSGPFLSLEQKD